MRCSSQIDAAEQLLRHCHLSLKHINIFPEAFPPQFGERSRKVTFGEAVKLFMAELITCLHFQAARLYDDCADKGRFAHY